MKKLLLAICFILLLPFQAMAAIITCNTMNGNGSTDNTAALNTCITAAQSETEKQVNIPTSAGTYYFSQTYDNYLTVPEGITLNQVGETAHINGTFRLSSGSKLINMNFVDRSRAVILGQIGYSSGFITGAEIRDCSFGVASTASIQLSRAHETIIDNNTFINNYDGDAGQNISVNGGQRNVISNNYTYGGMTSILHLYSALANGGTGEGMLHDNIIIGNTCEYSWEEGITFDTDGSASFTQPFKEYDTISAINSNQVTLSSAGWGGGDDPDYVGFEMVFMDGDIIGETREITGQSNAIFTLDSAVTGASVGDKVIIAATQRNNIIAYNTVNHARFANASILLYGLAFNNKVFNNTIRDGSISIRSLDNMVMPNTLGTYGVWPKLGNVTQTYGRSPCGYNLIKDNNIGTVAAECAARDGCRMMMFYYNLGHDGGASGYTRYRTYGNAIVDNAIITDIYCAYTDFYKDGNTGGFALTNVDSTYLNIGDVVPPIDLTDPTCENIGFTCSASCESSAIPNLDTTCPSEQVCCGVLGVGGNTAPNGTITVTAPQRPVEIGDGVTLEGSASDSEDDVCTYVWVIEAHTFKHWEVGTTYYPTPTDGQYSLVEDADGSGTYYKCILESTGHDPPNATYWVNALTQQNPGKGQCDTAGVYSIGLTVNDGTVDDPTPASESITVNAGGGTGTTTAIWSKNTTETYAGDYSEGDSTFLVSGYPVTNYGSNDSLLVQYVSWGGGYNFKSLLEFGLDHVDISGETVTDATLGLQLETNPPTATTNIEIWSCDSAFVEGEATWSIYSTGNAWASTDVLTGHGRDTFLGEFALTTSSPEGTWYTVSSPALIFYVAARALAGETCRFLIVADVHAAGIVLFHSDDATDGIRPYLEISYGAESASTPEVVSINIPGWKPIYKEGEVIPAPTVLFSEPVVGTSLVLTLDTDSDGANDDASVYVSGSGTALYTLTPITVTSDHHTDSLDSLTLTTPAGVIASADDATEVPETDNVIDTIPLAATIGSLAYNTDIAIDTTAPAIDSVNNTDSNCTADTGANPITEAGVLVKFAVVADTLGLYTAYSPTYYRLEMTVHPSETVYAEFQGFGETTDTLIMGFYTTAGMRTLDLNFTGDLILGAGGHIMDPAGNPLPLDMGVLSLADVAEIVINVAGSFTVGTGYNIDKISDLVSQADTDVYLYYEAVTDNVDITVDHTMISTTGGTKVNTGTLTFTGDNNRARCVTFSGGVTDNGAGNIYNPMCGGAGLF